MTVREALQRLAHHGPPHLRDELTAYAVSRGATYRTLLPILGLRSTGSITQRLARRKVAREPILDDPCPVHLRPDAPPAPIAGQLRIDP